MGEGVRKSVGEKKKNKVVRLPSHNRCVVNYYIHEILNLILRWLLSERLGGLPMGSRCWKRQQETPNEFPRKKANKVFGRPR